MHRVSDGLLVCLSLLVALLLVAAFVGVPRVSAVREAHRESLWVAGGGALAFGVAPLLVLSQRATDAPPGSEVLFFTTACWAGLVVAAAGLVPSERPAAVNVAGVVTGVVGAAGLLANWERPSSFSPFVRYPTREALMLVAGVAFAAGLVLLARGARVQGAKFALTLGLAAAACVAAVAALFGGAPEPAVLGRMWPVLLLLGLAQGLFGISIVRLAAHDGVARAAAGMLVPPVAVTALAALERATGVFGPNPIQWTGVAAAGVVALVGAAAVGAPRATSELRVRGALYNATKSIAAIAVAAGAVSLAFPAFHAAVEGIREGGALFSAGFTLTGAEAAIGWLPLAAALLVGAGVLEARNRAVARRLVLLAAAALVVLGAAPWLIDTPLRTWTSWIPAEVQQAYGTEYARLTFTVDLPAVRVAAIVATCVAALFLGALAFVVYRTRGAEKES